MLPSGPSTRMCTSRLMWSGTRTCSGRNLRFAMSSSSATAARAFSLRPVTRIWAPGLFRSGSWMSPVPLGDMTDSESALADGLADPPGLDADRNRPLQLLSATPLLDEFFFTAAPLCYLELYGGHVFFGCAQRPLDHQGPFRVLAGVGADLNLELLDLGGVASAFSYGDADVFGKDLHREDHALLEHVLLDELLNSLMAPRTLADRPDTTMGDSLSLGTLTRTSVLFPDVTDAGALADGLAVVRCAMSGEALSELRTVLRCRELFEHQRMVLSLPIKAQRIPKDRRPSTVSSAKSRGPARSSGVAAGPQGPVAANAGVHVRHEVAGVGHEHHAEILRGLASLLEESPAVLLNYIHGQANASVSLLGEGLAGWFFHNRLRSVRHGFSDSESEKLGNLGGKVCVISSV
ncbi:hypothetical protein C7M84_020354 [Penaeus vannamei]|uniref:Uncharacterized protein n=1 Tax=Penaeus vannamei TaxID=6689 RepID=A0A3R7SHT4_PENVA|nr:hypothetical protein C7M84_020354 [Penaeus vannamei]